MFFSYISIMKKKVKEFVLGLVALGVLIPALIGVAKYVVVCWELMF